MNWSMWLLTLFLQAMGRISPYMSVTWQQPVGIGLRDGPLFTPQHFTNSNDITIFCGFGIISEIIDPSDCWAVFLSLSDAAWYDENGSMVGRSAFVPKAKRKNSRLGSKARSPTALGYETNFWESTCAAAVGTNDKNLPIIRFRKFVKLSQAKIDKLSF